mgnify:CR=1 FL=1|jgi:DNA-binding NarL/FixJ family response regulator
MIKVLIVDDQSLVREGLCLMLSMYDNIKLVGEATNGKEAVEFLTEKEVDLILMDIRMPVIDGVEATKIIKAKYPLIKIIILTTFNEDEYIIKGIKNGADSYLLKDISSKDLVKAIETVYSGNTLFQPDIIKKIINKVDNSAPDISFQSLTRREKEIAVLVSEGKTNKEIAELLFITEGTVKNHMSNILDKLAVRDRTQLAILVKKNIT